MPNPPFTVAGMSSTSNSHHGQNAWTTSSAAGTLSNSLADSLSQSRTHYQSGYLLSASQHNNAPQGNQRVDEVPVVPTKAKMNHSLARSNVPTSFGVDSMFESTRRPRKPLADEDAPPTASINDIPTETPMRFQPKSSIFEKSALSRRTNNSSPPQSNQAVYVIVFGYPADKYSVTAEYFKSLGETTEPDPNTQILNCFRIGFMDPIDAKRAVRKNGEVLSGTWMVGVKFADPLQAEELMGALTPISSFAASRFPGPVEHNAMDTDTYNGSSSTNNNYFYAPNAQPSVGKPISLAPSAAAFRRGDAPNGGPGAGQTPMTPQTNKLMASTRTIGAPAPPQTPNKSVIGQVSDLIFGW